MHAQAATLISQRTDRIISGALGVFLCALCVVIFTSCLLRQACRSLSNSTPFAFSRTQTTSALSKKRVILRLCVVAYATLQLPFYGLFFARGIMLPDGKPADWVWTICYSSHLVAKCVLAASFILLSVLCMDLLLDDLTSCLRPDTACAYLLIFTYMGMTGWFVAINQRDGYVVFVEEQSSVYQAALVAHTVVALLICFGFLTYSALLRRALRLSIGVTPTHMDRHLATRDSTHGRQCKQLQQVENLLRKLKVIVALCSGCFLLKIVMISLLYAHHWWRTVGIIDYMPLTVWYLLSSWFPDFGLVGVIFHFTRNQRETAVDEEHKPSTCSPSRSSDVTSATEPLLVEQNNLYDRMNDVRYSARYSGYSSADETRYA